MQLFSNTWKHFSFPFLSRYSLRHSLSLIHPNRHTRTHARTDRHTHTHTHTHTHSQTHARTSTVFPRQEEPVSICATNLLNKLNRFLVYSHRSNILTDNRNFKMNMPLKNFLVKYFFKTNKVKTNLLSSMFFLNQLQLKTEKLIHIGREIQVLGPAPT